MKFSALVSIAALSGCCLANMPPDSDPKHLAIRWSPDVESACRAARRDQRPLLVIMISGDLQDRC